MSKNKNDNTFLNFENIKLQNVKDSDGMGSIYEQNPEFSLKGNSIKENEIFDEKVSIHESMYKRSQCSRSSVIMKKKKDFSIV